MQAIPNNVQQELFKLQTAIDKIRDKIASRTLSPDEIQYWAEQAKLLQRRYRVLRSEYDLLYFAYEYFSDTRNPMNENNLIPSGTVDTAPNFHKELCGKLDTLNDHPTKKICWGAPRGHAKSAYLSNIYPVHQIVYKKRKYVVIISETFGMAQKFVEFVGDQLRSNQKLREDFGILLHSNRKANEVDNLEGFVTTSDIKVQASSIGSQLRGSRHKNARPDLVICDDLESQKTCNTKELRDKNLQWFNAVVMPMLDIAKGSVIYMGTMVHSQGLLNSVLKRSDFESRIYSAIVSEPVRRDLWDQLEELLRDVENPNREAEADAIYYANEEVYSEGAETLWNSRFSYYELMKIKLNVGSRAFSSEYLNQAADSESCVFKSDHFVFYNEHELAATRYHNLDLFAFWDIAIGKSATKGDYNAIVTIGRDRTTGIIYVIDAWADRVPMHEALKVALQKIRQFRPKVMGVESVQAQYDQFRQLREKVMKEGLYSTRVLSVIPRGRKEDRIETLEPLIEAGYLRFNKGHRLLMEQMELFGNGSDHDDLPDALQQAVEIAGKQRKRTYYKKTTGFLKRGELFAFDT